MEPEVKRKQIIEKARRDLIKALEKKLDKNLELIFRLLGLKYPPEDIYNAYLGLKSDELEIRTNAVEFLDNILSVNLKKFIIPIVEMALFDTITDNILEQYGYYVLSEYECLEMILSDMDDELKELTLNLITALHDKQYIPVLTKCMGCTDQPIKKIAETTLQLLERV